MAKRKSEEVPPVGVVAGAAVGPWLGVGVPHALATIASAASSPIARRVRRLMTQCLLGLLRVPVRPTCLDDGAEPPAELGYADVMPDRAAPAIASGVTSSAKWHATRCPGRISRDSGTFVSHSVGCSSRSRSQQRVWKRQPDGGFAGDGTSPFRTIRRLRTVGSGSGMADMRLTVYGCCGLS